MLDKQGNWENKKNNNPESIKNTETNSFTHKERCRHQRVQKMQEPKRRKKKKDRCGSKSDC